MPTNEKNQVRMFGVLPSQGADPIPVRLATEEAGDGMIEKNQVRTVGVLPVQGADPILVSGISAPTIYRSGWQAVASASLETFPHGLGEVPDVVTVFLKCLVAEGGFSIGDVVNLNAGGNFRGSWPGGGFACWIDDTNINIRLGAHVNPISLVNKGSGAEFLLTLARWEMAINAIRF